MEDRSGPIYEVTLDIDCRGQSGNGDEAAGESFDDVDAWLSDHVRHMLEIPGFVDAVDHRADSDDAGSIRHVTHYYLESDAALAEYLAGPAAAMRLAVSEHFGERVKASRRVLHRASSAAPGSKETCRNCGTPLSGQYCSRCGQRARSRLISIWELVRDAIGDLFELDSRLWQTLIPLVFSPGSLTRDYLTGRRARFMPPFRTYLVLSVVFFLVAFFDPRQQLGILFEPAEPSIAADDAGGRTPGEMRQEVLDELRREGVIVGDPPPVPSGENVAGEQRTGANIQFTAEGDPVFNCDFDDFSMEGAPEWLSKRLTLARLQAVCEKISADSGRAFFNQLLDNVPVALFVLLPLMALVLKMLFPLSKRYYAEHLLFVLHFHAFFFLILTVEVLITRLAATLRMPELPVDLTILVISLYIPVYLYKAMRRVYDQGRVITLLKYVVLVLAYVFGFASTLLVAAFVTAFSI
jgi:hypothetical protein